MELDEKTRLLQELDEAALQTRVLVPLLARLGFQAPVRYHGANERGKDIVCFDYDRLGQRIYVAVVAKATDLTGSVSSSRGLREVCYQVEQCFNDTFVDLYGMKTVTMDFVWVVTSGRILPSAREAVAAHLEKQNVSKITRFLSGTDLVGLIDEHFVAFWDHADESPENVRAQRDRAVGFVRAMLRALGAAPDEARSVIGQLLNSTLAPRIGNVRDHLLFHASPYSVEVGEISPEYAEPLADNTVGNVAKQFMEARDLLKSAFYPLEEALDNASEILKCANPRDFVARFDDELSREEPFHSGHGSAGECLKCIDWLRQALDDLDELRERLEGAGKLGWAEEYNSAISKCRDSVEAFLSGRNSDGEFVVHWGLRRAERGAIAEFMVDASRQDFEIVLETNHSGSVPVYGGRRSANRPIRAEDVIDGARSAFRTHLDGIVPPASDGEDDL